MSIEEKLKEFILARYKSLRDFCVINGFAYSTIYNIFQRGIKRSGVTLMISVCRSLNIDVDELANGKIVEKQPTVYDLTSREASLVLAYRAHPEMQQAVDRLLGVEAAGTVGEDIASEVSEAMKKSHVLK